MPIEPIEITWLVAVDDTGRFGRRRRAIEEIQGRVVEVSVTGAAIEAPNGSGLRVGARVTIRAFGGDSVVKVRRTQATDQPGLCRYGVEFITLDGGLGGRLTSILDRGRPGESTWRRSL